MCHVQVKQFFFHYFLHYSSIVKYQTFLTNPLLKKSSFFISYSSYLKPSFVTNKHTDTYHTNIDLSLSYANLINSYLNFREKNYRKRQKQKSQKPNQPVTQHHIRVTFSICLSIQTNPLIACANKYHTEK